MNIPTTEQSKKYYEYASDSYLKFTPDFLTGDKLNQYILENNESIISFLTSYQEQFGDFNKQSSILETGCGLGGISHYLSSRGYYTKGIDQSSLAISMAKEINKQRELYTKFEKIDLCQTKATDKFEVIVDSHLLHCLVEQKDRDSYLKFIHDSLTDDGLFFLETMSYQPKIQIPLGYELDENLNLYKEMQSEMIPFRRVCESHELEQEIKNANMKIKYLYFHNELSFDLYTEYPNFSFEHLPKTIRLVASK